jgi:uncharacterized protein YqgC (DUF456 family)
VTNLPDWLRVLVFGLTQIVVLVGLFGLLIPIFPAYLIMWLAMLGYGLIVGFSSWGIFFFVLITLLMLAGTLVDNVLMGAGARTQGASWLTIIVALVFGVVGTIVFPPLGGLIAAPLGILLLEYWRTRDLRKAWNALIGMAAGWGLSVFVRFGVGLVMMVLWWAWVWVG